MKVDLYTITYADCELDEDDKKDILEAALEQSRTRFLEYVQSTMDFDSGAEVDENGNDITPSLKPNFKDLLEGVIDGVMEYADDFIEDNYVEVEIEGVADDCKVYSRFVDVLAKKFASCWKYNISFAYCPNMDSIDRAEDGQGLVVSKKINGDEARAIVMYKTYHDYWITSIDTKL